MRKEGTTGLIKKLLLFVILAGQSVSLFAQISDNSLPESFLFSTKSLEIIPSYPLDSVKVDERIREDKQSGMFNRFGIVQEININIREEGLKTANGNINIWRYKIYCPDALSLGIKFDLYDVPEGAGVYIYSSDKQNIRGAFTDQNNNNHNRLQIAQLPGNALIIEYNEPINVEFPGKLEIGSVSKSYLSLKSVANSWVQINCEEGQDWQDEKHAVCLMTFDEGINSYYCTGSLINNVRLDGTPYFLTANHCISSNTVAETLVTYFNYENSTCDSNDASLDQSLSGAELVATNNYSDFTLLKLSEYPPEEYYPYYAGWDASGDQPNQGTSIHHPEGSYKCIAIDYDGPVSYGSTIQWDNRTRTMPNTHWEVSYDVGTDESGSSGCPLFDENKRIVGQLHGGDSNYSYFGKFSVSWDHSSSGSGQLEYWLDPDNLGTLRLDGINYFDPPKADFSSDVSIACLNTTVYFTDLSKLPTDWHWSFSPTTVEFVNGTDKYSQNPQITFSEEGIYSVTLTVGNANGFDTITYKNLIQAKTTFDVNFPGFPDEITVCGSELQDYLMVAEGANEYSFEISEADNFEVETNSYSLVLMLKDEARKFGSFDMVVKVTGSHGNCSSSDSVLFHVIMPKNDDIANSIELKLGRNAYYSNQCGTVEQNEPHPSTSGCLLANNWCSSSNSSILDNTIWFTFQGPSSGNVTIETEGFDTQIAVYEADSYSNILLGNYNLMAAADNSSLGDEAIIENMEVTPFQTYWLQVDGNDGSFGDLAINLITNSIEVDPNPSLGVFNLTLSTEIEGTVLVEVFAVTGQRVYSDNFNSGYDSNTVTFDLSGVPSGIYFFRTSINGLLITKKLIISR